MIISIVVKKRKETYMMTVTVYASSCRSSRKAKDWLAQHDIPFNERNINKRPLTINEIKEILHMTDEGTDEIISRRSKDFERLAIDFDTISLQQLIQLIYENPGLIRLPIIMDEKRLQVGFKEEEISQFLPREARKNQLIELRKLSYDSAIFSL